MSRQKQANKTGIMPQLGIAAVACLLLSACGYQTPLPDTAIAPAINLASWAFSSSRNTHDHPIETARSVAAVDYLAGELSSNPRWIGMSPFVQMEMLQARQQVRSAMGIDPNARSQFVIDSLSRYAASLADNGDQAKALQYLSNPAFTLGPQITEARLEQLPFMSLTNIATQRAASSIGDGSGTSAGGSNLP